VNSITNGEIPKLKVKINNLEVSLKTEQKDLDDLKMYAESLKDNQKTNKQYVYAVIDNVTLVNADACNNAQHIDLPEPNDMITIAKNALSKIKPGKLPICDTADELQSNAVRLSNTVNVFKHNPEVFSIANTSVLSKHLWQHYKNLYEIRACDFESGKLNAQYKMVDGLLFSEDNEDCGVTKPGFFMKDDVHVNEDFYETIATIAKI